MRIALTTIATGRYIEFVPPLLDSASDFFLREHDVTFHVFTDRDASNWAYSHYTFHERWPLVTLHRHRTLTDWFRRTDACEQYDYVFHCDSDMRFSTTVGDEILSDLVATIHPGFYGKRPAEFSYERRSESLACIKRGSGERYYAGGFQGGASQVYFAACREIADRVSKDEHNGITAVWHDESHWNRYLFEHPPTLELDPGYCYPESWTLPFERKILALDKDHAAMRA